MVRIQEQDDEEHQQQHHVVSITQHQHHQQQQRTQPSSLTTLNNQTTATMKQQSSSSHSPPQATAHSPTSSVSSISSDHTFHGFSPARETPPPHSSSSPPPPHASNPAPSTQALVPVNRLVRDPQTETVTVTKPDPDPKPKPDAGFGARREIPLIRRANGGKLVRRVGFVLRFFEFMVCLVSFSVMAADKNRGWALDSFDNYTEFRYSMSVNVIGFAYSGLQGLDLLHQLTTGKKFGSQVRYAFDFAIDQILAYLLLSASSSAFTRVDDWISNWGSDQFPTMASASVGVSFVAFIAFALSSLISGYLLCTHRFT